MVWSKDTTSQPGKTIYTPGTGDATPGLSRVILDPQATVSRRVTAEYAYVIREGETEADFDAGWGIA